MKKNEVFTDTYNRYGDLIFWYAKRRLSNEELSKECTQQVFLKYYEHMDVISEEMVKAWLLTCCKNEIIDYFRKIERRKGFENIDAPEVEVHICSQDNAEYVVERLNREAFYTEVLTALRKKNESWYQIVWAVCVEELSQEEAAERLGISPEILRAKLYRARKYIRRKFKDKYDLL